jgi:hypothetical protein
MSAVILALLAMAALSLGLRTTSVLIAGVQPMVRLLVSVIAGGVMTLAFLELCRSYQVFEFGLGLLVSLSPVGVFDVAKWWFTWRNNRLPG